MDLVCVCDFFLLLKLLSGGLCKIIKIFPSFGLNANEFLSMEIAILLQCKVGTLAYLYVFNY